MSDIWDSAANDHFQLADFALDCGNLSPNPVPTTSFGQIILSEIRLGKECSPFAFKYSVASTGAAYETRASELVARFLRGDNDIPLSIQGSVVLPTHVPADPPDPAGRISVTYTVPSPNINRPVEEGDARLQNNRVEFYSNGAWGTVCNTATANDNPLAGKNLADVVCRELGFEYGTYFAASDTIDAGATYPINLGGTGTAACSGLEKRLGDCAGIVVSPNNCDHSRDIGAKCFGGIGQLKSIHLLGSEQGPGTPITIPCIVPGLFCGWDSSVLESSGFQLLEL